MSSGSGGMLASDIALGGDQFQLPEQQGQMTTFFSNFYIYTNLGALLAVLIAPILRDKEWRGDEYGGYMLVFIVVLAVFCSAAIFLAVSRSAFKVRGPTRSVMSDFFHCIWVTSTLRHAMNVQCYRRFAQIGLKAKITKACCSMQQPLTTTRQNDWLKPAETKYGANFVLGVRDVLSVCVLYMTFPVFWALFDQMGSRWTFQAARMNRSVGQYVLLPDQIQLFNSFLVIVLVKFFDVLVYPVLGKSHHHRVMINLDLCP